MLFEGTAWAQQAAGGVSPEYSTVVQMLPIVGIIVIFYFVLIRPQSKRAQEHDKMLKALKRNDEVVTSGGIVGRIVELGDRLVVLEIAPNVRVRIERPQIASLSTYGKAPAKKGEG